MFIQPQPIDPYLDRHEALPGLVATIVEVSGASNTDGTFAAGDRITVRFSITRGNGRSLALGELDAAGAWFVGPTSNYQHILPAARDKTRYDDVRAAATYNGDGTYSYTLPDPIPATFGVPLYDTTKFTAGELSGALPAGTYSIVLNVWKRYYVGGEERIDDAHARQDVLYGNATTLAARAVVGDANCSRCHDEVEGHGGRYSGVDLCLTCHTSGAEDRDSTDTNDATPVTIDFKVMMHKLHNAAHLPSVLGVATKEDGSRDYAAAKVPYKIGADDFSAILYPAFPNFNIALPKDQGYSGLPTATRALEDNIRKGVSSCADCHGDPDGGGPLAAPAQGDFAYTAPSREVCGSCHDDVDWTRPYVANSQTMLANQAADSCATCHGSDPNVVTSIQRVHRHPIFDPSLSADVAFQITSVSGGTGTDGRLVAGDRPVVGFTIKAGVADAPITDFTSLSLAVTGPTNNRQVVIPGALAASPYDFGGRLASASTSNKGSMGRVQPGGATVSETLVVTFTSATQFEVEGLVTGALGTGTLPGATSAYPSGASFANVLATGNAVPRALIMEMTSDKELSLKAGDTSVGSGTLPAALSTVARVTSNDKSIAFNLTVGTTAFTPGDKTHMVVFKGAAANPVVFIVIAGKTAFAAGDRFYYDYVAPAASYTTKVPMDLQFEYIGKGSGTLQAANAPVWYGRQTLWEETARVGTPTTLTAASRMLVRHVTVASANGLAKDDYLAFDADLATAEYARISAVDAATGKITLTQPLRFAHNAGAGVSEVTLTYRQAGVDYELDPGTGVVTLTNASTNPFVMSYRSDGRFGWKRSVADTLQSVYWAPLDAQEKTDETWGDWRGKSLVDGTYTFALWGYIPIEYGLYGEWQTYRGTTKSARQDVLVGATATTVEPYSFIESGASCATCHNELSFHGGGREGADTCFLCHGTAGGSVHFNSILHEAHEAILPVMPNGSAQCVKCHGGSEVWQAPTDRNHPTMQGRDVRDWSISCTGCHSWSEAVAHTDIMTAPNGVESCTTCHGIGKELEVELVHDLH